MILEKIKMFTLQRKWLEEPKDKPQIESKSLKNHILTKHFIQSTWKLPKFTNKKKNDTIIKRVKDTLRYFTTVALTTKDTWKDGQQC